MWCYTTMLKLFDRFILWVGHKTQSTTLSVKVNYGPQNGIGNLLWCKAIHAIYTTGSNMRTFCITMWGDNFRLIQIRNYESNYMSASTRLMLLKLDETFICINMNKNLSSVCH